MSLTMENNNQTITMTIGETKQIQLKGNPTTGYSWIALESSKVENVIQFVEFCKC
jgi:predicted secreted protein